MVTVDLIVGLEGRLRGRALSDRQERPLGIFFSGMG